MKSEISKNQEQFWILQKLFPDSSIYNIPTVIKCEGVLDIEILRKSINIFISKHEILKTIFLDDNGKIIQEIPQKKDFEFKISYVAIDAIFQSNNIPQIIDDEINTPFNLTVWPLFRVKLFEFKNNITILTIVFHHIIIDLHSKLKFGKDISELYNQFLRGRIPTENKIDSNYFKYIHWQRNWLRSEDVRVKEQFWREFISTEHEYLSLPSDIENKMDVRPIGKRIIFTLDIETSILIKKVSNDYNINSFIVLLSAYSIFLHRYSGQDNILVGIPFTNRKLEDFKETFGCFINIVPLPIEFFNEQTGLDIITQIRYKLLQIHRNQELPFLKIKEILSDNKNSAFNYNFNTGFTFEPPMNLEIEGVITESLAINKNGSQLDLFLTLWEENDHFNGYWEYSSLKFSDNNATQLNESFILLIKNFCLNILTDINDFNILSYKDKIKLNKWNNTSKSYSTDVCIHEIFEKQVKRFPYATAIVYNNSSIPYYELNQKANRIAKYLIENGVKIEDRVGICMQRCPEIVICILAILKSGAIYLPLDPTYPKDRLRFILDDSEPKIIFSKESFSANLPSGNTIVNVETILSDSIIDNYEDPKIPVHPNNLAYIIYTSGSTGMPKGVMIEHHSVINKIEWMQDKHHLTRNDTLILKTPITFDVSIWELFWWFFSGSKLLILLPGEEKFPDIITKEVQKNNVTAIIFVPSMFSEFVNYIKYFELAIRLCSLKWIIQIGEILTPQLVKDFNTLCSNYFNPLLVNTYGPAEATIAVTYYNCPKDQKISKIYIGKPIANTKIFILNKKNEIQPINVQGELAISGVNLARGYLNRDELNYKKFISIKDYSGGNTIVYKTGDIARWCDNGQIEFFGRIDNQIKLRGYRIELGDIETKLLNFSKIKIAAVEMKQLSPDNNILIGYAELKKGCFSTSEEIKEYLSTQLPEYMIPSQINIIENIPLNSSEKIDRIALSKMNFHNEFIVLDPESDMENKLIRLWRKLLNRKDILISQNFFDLGGNSLLLIRMAVEIKIQFGIPIEPNKIFNYPSIQKLAEYLVKYSLIDDKLLNDNINKIRNFSRFRPKK